MSKTAVITARVDEELLALVDRVSAGRQRSCVWFRRARAVAEAAAAREYRLRAVGIDAALGVRLHFP